jgi:hypothetical protein
MIAMPSQPQYSRQYAVDLLKRLGYRELADEALLELPDPVEVHRLEEWCSQHGLSYSTLISQMGGSP